MPTPYLIGVAGMMGSGKTTLSRGLAERLNFSLLPTGRLGNSYLVDLFSDSRRWAFETQVSFLIQKAQELLRAHEEDIDAILDRTISEDMLVFAEHFRASGQLDDRSYHTYTVLAHHFTDTLPTPDLVIFCKCPLSNWPKVL